MLLSGVLGGDHHEGVGEWHGAAVDGDLAFAHGFEKGGLGLGSGAVDFVGQEEVGEDGAGAEFEVLKLGPVDGNAGDVAGEEV